MILSIHVVKEKLERKEKLDVSTQRLDNKNKLNEKFLKK